MDLKTPIPNFNVALRGYDREEVEEYLDSLASSLANADDAQEHIRRLQAQVSRMGARIRDLEDRISADTPKTGAVLGEKIGLLLRQAEEAASDTISRAQGEAHHIESEARVKASDIVAAAEGRASARTRQIEDWAQDVIAHARDEEARVLAEVAKLKERSEESLRAMEASRQSAAAQLAALRDALGRALEEIEPAGTVTHPAPAPALEDSGIDPVSAETATASAPAFADPAAATAGGTGSAEPDSGDDGAAGSTGSGATTGVGTPGSGAAGSGAAGSGAAGSGGDESLIEVDDVTFEAKFDAWVSDTGSVNVVDLDKLERG